MNVLIVMIKLTVIMILVALSLYSTYIYVRKHRGIIKAKYKFQPYGCGEELTREQVSVGSRGLYWSVVSKVFNKLYMILREKIHTGVLGDWFSLMIIFLVVIVIVLIALSLIGVFG